jgi:hypothetical protein
VKRRHERPLAIGALVAAREDRVLSCGAAGAGEDTAKGYSQQFCSKKLGNATPDNTFKQTRSFRTP